MNIPVFVPLIEEEEMKNVQISLEQGWLGMGSYVGDFESAIERLVTGPENRKVHAVAVSTGHAALHLALLDIGIKEGDEVITPSFNNIADFQAILATGAQPVFCDIDEETLCIDPQEVEKLITKKTKAIIIMDYACHLCDYTAFIQLQEKTGIQVIHDAAHSFGGFYEGSRIGGIFDYTMYSFDPVKNITCIDGGALLVKNEETRTRLREMRLIGMGQPSEVMYQNKRAWTYDVKRIGFRYHMANLHAAFGLSQLSKLDDIMNSRLQSFEYYNQALEGLKNIRLPRMDLSNSKPLPFIYYLRIANGQRDRFIEYMRGQEIDTGIHWQAGHNFSLLKECHKGKLDVTDIIVNEIVTIPFHSKMKMEHQNKIIDAIRKFDNEI